MAGEPELAAAWEAEVTARVADARKITELLEYRDRKVAEAVENRERADNFTRRAVVKAAHHQAGVLLGVPERHIESMLGTAATARKWLPQLWDQFCRGRIDLSRLKVLVSGAGDLIETNSGRPEAQQELTAALDAQFAAAAPAQNEQVLKEQVHQHVAHADPSCDQRRYERACSSRGVSLVHHSNGMSTLRAVLPTLNATRIYQQLDAAAAAMPRQQAHPESGEPEDTTRYNRMADVLTEWIDRGAAYGSSQSLAERAAAAVLPSPRPAAATINITVPLETSPVTPRPRRSAVAEPSPCLPLRPAVWRMIQPQRTPATSPELPLEPMVPKRWKRSSSSVRATCWKASP
ncbi:DUF222 domain-containing protein [Nesterenkonia ebinurensis]|uniref:DUF222 domain-containing protein n=1 Tax=Nesterenkonia ebinurensis TaxID=2608252 RepID=UPI00168A53A7|nr:DUF222 domain-containing protein [Nesterenkonia ebinurensis]